MSKKYFFMALLFQVIFYALYSEDVYFRTIKNTPVWQGSFYTSDRILFELPKDTIVTGVSGALIDWSYNRTHTPFQVFNFNDSRYVTYIESLVPAETYDLFPKELITDSVSNDRKYLILNYYIEALAVKNRDIIFNQDILFWQWLVAQPRRDQYDERSKWWEFVWFFDDNNFLIFQTTIKFSNQPYYTLELLIKNIQKHNKSYHVSVKIVEDVYYNLEVDNQLWKNTPISKIPKPSQREFFDLIITPDGDYLDVYVDNYNTHFATFVCVDKQLMEELNKLIKTGTCNNINNISWPHRSPKQLSVGEECRVLENLKIMKNPDTAGTVITTLEQGSKVTILEIGQSDIIDGVSDKWVKVKTANEEEGWCFGLYLRETRFEPTPEELAVKVKSKAKNAYGSAKGKTSKIILISGIAILLGGGTAVFLIKRKK